MTRMLLSALLAQAVPPFEGPPYSGCVEVGTAAPAEQKEGGWWLPHPRGQRIACLLETCEARRAQLEATPVPAAPWVWFAVGLLAGALGGGWLVAVLLR